MAEASVLMAAARIAAMIRPDMPGGISSTINLMKISSAVASPRLAGRWP